ncbi:MAG: DNA mismatch repair endonuclease MutL [Ruminococcus sp.]|jgi:DNA mismatch repair protein MutL|nr:DNA mismatch repair endonuclease MutL [Ruminococcus sp.]
MSKIKILSKETSELIAAGEVIERPLSVAKELIENAVDSGATKITIEISGGGISLLRVTDNGCGIAFDDVPTMFLRHATSKISNGSDLENLNTLGFRGEALASICAVSHTEIFTKESLSDLGTHYKISGGVPGELERVGCPDGTSVIVRDLFYNVPARLKFLRKDVSEANAVAGIVKKIALSHPEISFSFIRNNEQELITSGNGDLYSAIYAVLGRQFAASLTAVDYSYNGIRVTGFVSKPLFARANRSLQNFFVNGRYIRSFTCVSALEEAFKNSIMVGKFPACVLQINLPPAIMDVNAHPVKIEVKFSDDKLIYDCIFFAVKNALLSEQSSVEIEIKKETEDESFKLSYMTEKSSPPEVFPSEIIPQNSERYKYIFSTPKVTPQPENDEILPIIPTETVDEIKLIGEAFLTYIIVEYGSDLYLIDKHAAHERILYEKIKSRPEELKCQYTLSETSFCATDEFIDAASQFSEDLTAIGYDFDVKSGIITVRGIPSILDGCDIEAAFCEILENLSKHKNNPLPEVIDELYHSIACKAAIKGSRFTGSEELSRLANRVLFDEKIRYCPHGRPVIFKLSRRELERNFKRIQ